MKSFKKNKQKRIDLSESQMEFQKGEEIGKFKYGSTIILLFQNGKTAPLEKFNLSDSSVQVGKRITISLN